MGGLERRHGPHFLQLSGQRASTWLCKRSENHLPSKGPRHEMDKRAEQTDTSERMLKWPVSTGKKSTLPSPQGSANGSKSEIPPYPRQNGCQQEQEN